MNRTEIPLRGLCLHVLEFALILSLGVAHARGQVSVSGEITGIVTDNTGAAVPEVTVVALNNNTNVATQTETNHSGVFRVFNLIPGTYAVTLEKTGFKKFVREGVVVGVDNVVRVDAPLEVGTVTQSVIVTGAAPMLKTDKADVSQTLDTQEVANLPTPGRNITQLVQLVPGATMASSQLTGWVENSGNDFQTNINGQPGYNSNRQLDGVDNNETIQGLSMVVASEDSVHEVSVTTNNYDAEYGRVSGAVIQVSTKSGTNSWNGSLFWFYQSSGFFARNPFTEPIKPASFVWQQFGGSQGGSIVKNKLFFFGDYQGVRNVNGSSVLTTVPTAAFQTGDFSALATSNPIFDPNTGNPDGTGRTQFSDPTRGTPTNPLGLNIIPLNRLSTAATQLLSFMPAPTDPTLNTNNFTTSGGGLVTQNQFSSRIDYNQSSKNTLFGRYNLFQSDAHVPTAYGDVVGGPPLGGIISGHGTALNQSWLTSYTRVWSPSLLSDFRFLVARIALNNVTNNATLQTANDIGMNGINITGTELTNGIPGISVGGPVGAFTTTQGLPFVEYETNIHVVNNWTKTSGSHSFKWGFDIGKAFLRRRDTTGRGSETVSQSVTENAAIYGCCMAEGMRALYTVWSNIITANSQGVFVNLSLNRNSEWARVISSLPERGRIDVTAHKQGDYFLRPPAWAPRAMVQISRGGQDTPVKWAGPGLAYLSVKDVKPGEVLSLVYPLVTRSQTVGIWPSKPDLKLTIQWKGNSVVDMEPKSHGLPVNFANMTPVPLLKRA